MINSEININHSNINFVEMIFIIIINMHSLWLSIRHCDKY